MAGRWSVEETKALIAMWGQENVQNQLERIHRNCDVYQRILSHTKIWLILLISL